MSSFKNEKEKQYVDLLDEDKAISGQKFVCISFLSPEKILKNKELYFFEEFTKNYDWIQSMEKFQDFLQFISYKYKVNNESIMTDLEDFVKNEKQSLITNNLEDQYKNFIDKNEEKLENEFMQQNKFQTSTRGIKIRGVFATQEEAEIKCKMLREVDPNHDVYVGPVGLWMPWEPEAYKTGRVEYLEEELNKLMHEKFDNEKGAKIEFEKRVREAKEKAMEENKKSAEKTGNPLTQIMNESGELVNVKQVDYDSIPDENVIMEPSSNTTTSANIKDQVFNSVNIDNKKKED
tara:strand:- start:1069 stop:1941 length:873 start_codon:yes stop_codon:yes gene_type:complete